MKNWLLDNSGNTLTVIGGTSAYIKVTPSVAGTVDGKPVSLPVSFDDAAMTAGITGNGGAGWVAQECPVRRGENGASVVVVSSQATAPVARFGEFALELKAVLSVAIPNTNYQPGDVLGFRWVFYVSEPLSI